MTIERWVRGYGIERTDIFVSSDGDENTVGVEEAGSDRSSAAPTSEARDDAALNGAVALSVDAQDDELADRVPAAFAEFDADEAVEQILPSFANF